MSSREAEDDRTIAVNGRQVGDDETIAVSPRERNSGTASGTTSGTGGAPVEEETTIPPELARLMFKSPLDPKRRAPASPFPADPASLPRGGVRAGIPVVYGTRSEEAEHPGEAVSGAEWIGPPPDGYTITQADRDGIPSTARLNRRFRLVVGIGGVATLSIVAAGFWWIWSVLA